MRERDNFCFLGKRIGQNNVYITVLE